MKISVLPVFLLTVLLADVLLGAEPRIFGYFEFQTAATAAQKKILILNSNKLRIDLQAGVSENVMFKANVNLFTYHGSREWNVLDFIDPSLSGSVSDEQRSAYRMTFSSRSVLDNAFLKLSFKGFDVLAGKQQISLGTGYVWNPTDIFNIKDILDPTYEQPGHNALRVDVALGRTASLSFLYAPEKTWKLSSRMVRFKTRLSHFDISLVAVKKGWAYHDYSQPEESGKGFDAAVFRRTLLGCSVAGELFGLGVWAEYAYNWMENQRDFSELVLGFDYTFDFQTHVMAEYFRKSDGKCNRLKYDLNDWMRTITSEQRSLCRDQLYINVKHPVTDFIDLGTALAFCINDQSLALIPTLQFSIRENLDLTAYLNINLGAAKTIFAEKSGSGGIIRLRAYF